jgi:hypothetical protein
MISLPALSEVLEYDNASVISRFNKENPEISVEQAKQIFQDLLCWLWLSEHRSQRQLMTHMIAPLEKLDKMWHCFILHTQDYTAFCQKHFNRYLHHVVEIVGSEYVMATDELSAYLGDCFDQLGEEWLLRNFSY